MNTPLFKLLPLSWRFLFPLCLCFMLAVPVRASPVNCSKGTLVTVVAHLDGDLLVVEPAISERLRMGWCVTTVHLIGGANGGNLAYIPKREGASRLAYARLAWVGNTWEDDATSTGRLPSHMEAHSIGLLETQASGSPIVAIRIAAFEFARDIHGVSLVDTRNPSAWARALLQALHMPRTYRALDGYTLRDTAESYLTILQAIAKLRENAAAPTIPDWKSNESSM